MAWLNFYGFCLCFSCVAICLALTHCSISSEVRTGMCLPRATNCSCSNERVAKVTVKYCGRNLGKCVPCEDLGTLCLRRCREKGKTMHRQRRKACSDVDKPVIDGPPSINITNGLNRDVKAGDSKFHITCEVEAKPAASVSWLFRGKLLSYLPDKPKYHTSNHCNRIYKLQVLLVTSDDEGNYTCVATNKYGNSTAMNRVSVFKDVTIEIVSFETKDDAYAGDAIRITCEALGKDAVIQFRKSGVVVNEGGRYEYVQHKISHLQMQTSLEIKNVSVMDAGTYTCLAGDCCGRRARKSFNFTLVEEKDPYIERFQITDGKRTAYAGGTVNITCRAYARKGSILFGKSGKIFRKENATRVTFAAIPNLASDDMFVTASLEIKNVSMRDAGNYSCIVFDRRQKHVGTAYMNLVVVPCPKGHFCPPQHNEKQSCLSGTYNDGTNNATYECTPCPRNSDNNFTESLPGLESITECSPLVSVSPRKGPLQSHITDIVLYMSASVLGFVVLVSIGCFLAKRHSSSSGGQVVNVRYPKHFQAGDPETENWRIPEHEETDFEKKYDVFVCYSSKDTKYVQELIDELERRGFLCCVDFRNFVAGAPIVENISDAIYGSRKTLAVLSPEFIQSKWCKHEIQTALAVVGSHVVVPIKFKDCDIPTLLRDRTYLDWESSVVKPYFWDALDKALRVE